MTDFAAFLRLATNTAVQDATAHRLDPGPIQATAERLALTRNIYQYGAGLATHVLRLELAGHSPASGAVFAQHAGKLDTATPDDLADARHALSIHSRTRPADAYSDAIAATVHYLDAALDSRPLDHAHAAEALVDAVSRLRRPRPRRGNVTLAHKPGAAVDDHLLLAWYSLHAPALLQALTPEHTAGGRPTREMRSTQLARKRAVIRATETQRWTKADVAKMAGITRETLYRWVQPGKLAAIEK